MNTARPHARSTITSLIITVTLTTALASMAVAQSAQPPCNSLTQDRTITFCYPIDDANVGSDEVLLWGVVKDSLPHTNMLYVDGQNPDQLGDNFEGQFGANYF